MNKIIETIFGSHLYGTSTPDSDLDIKAIYLPTAKEIVLSNYKKTINISRNKELKERNTKNDTDIEIFSLDRYLELLAQGQTVALDILFTPTVSYPMSGYDIAGQSGAQIWQTIIDNKDKILHKNISAFLGYAKQQAARYGIKGSRMDALKSTAYELSALSDHKKLEDCYDVLAELVVSSNKLISLEKTPLIEIVYLRGPKGLLDAPHLRVNGRSVPLHATVKYAKMVVNKMLDSYGERAQKAHLAGNKDFKALSHAVRIAEEAKELLLTGNITFPRPEKDLLIKIKKGELPYEQVAEMIEQGIVDLVEAQKKSTLREKPDQDFIDNFICEVYSQIVRKG